MLPRFSPERAHGLLPILNFAMVTARSQGVFSLGATCRGASWASGSFLEESLPFSISSGRVTEIRLCWHFLFRFSLCGCLELTGHTVHCVHLLCRNRRLDSIQRIDCSTSPVIRAYRKVLQV